jgi:hypothetical protein
VAARWTGGIFIGGHSSQNVLHQYRLEVLNQYTGDLKKVLPGTKVFRCLQVEYKSKQSLVSSWPRGFRWLNKPKVERGITISLSC